MGGLGLPSGHLDFASQYLVDLDGGHCYLWSSDVSYCDETELFGVCLTYFRSNLQLLPERPLLAVAAVWKGRPRQSKGHQQLDAGLLSHLFLHQWALLTLGILPLVYWNPHAPNVSSGRRR